jgi:acetyl esterase/lipase
MGVVTHKGTRNNLLGNDPDPALVSQLSTDLQVNDRTPPCFVWHTWEDPAVPVDNTLLFVQALRNAGVPFECHIYQDGLHGLGMKDGHHWIVDCLQWMKMRLRASPTTQSCVTN